MQRMMPPSAEAQRNPPVLNERYRIDTRLGDRRLATVYRATDLQLQRPVLLHVLRKELASQAVALQRFQDQIALGAQQPHPVIPAVYDSGVIGERPFLVGEDVSGRALRGIGALTPEEALLYLRQVATAIAACEAQGLSYPPISSSNLRLIGEGQIRLIDSWELSNEEAALDLAVYRAPERSAGAPASPSTVVYALGMLLFELLTGQRLVDGSDPQMIARLHQQMRVPALHDIRPALYLPALDRLLASALQPDPAQRLPDAATLAAALDRVWYDLHAATQRLPVQPQRVRQPSTVLSNLHPRQLLADALPTGGRLRPAPRAAPAGAAIPHPAPAVRYRPSALRTLSAWVILIVLFGSVAFGAYWLASELTRGIGIELPRPQISLPQLPDLGIRLPSLPGWLTGVVEGQGDILLVNVSDSLRLRDAPGLRSNVIADIPGGTRVRQLEGPVVADEEPWLRVALELNGQRLEGWMAQKFLKPE